MKTPTPPPFAPREDGPSGASTRKRVLVVAWYFPPMGLSGVQRMAKFVRYLPGLGWEPTVLTVEPAGYFAFDEDLLREVLAAGIRVERTRSLDPTLLFGRARTVSMPGESRRRALSAISQTLFVPDNKVGWLFTAPRRAAALHRARPYDAILSSAPPYTAHLVADRVARRFGIPMVADFRDDWLGNPRHTYPTRAHRALSALLERRVVRSANRIVTINESIAASLRARHESLRTPGRVEVIPQGFDPEDYPEPAAREDPDTMRLVYTGVFYDAQSPAVFLEGLARFRSDRPDAPVTASFYGLFPEIERPRIGRLGLDQVVRVMPYVTHREAMRAVACSDVPWLVVGSRPGAGQISTGKLYAYMGARKPILALAPEGEARRALKAYGAAYFADPDDEGSIATAIGRVHDDWKAGRLPRPDESFVAEHDRERLAARLARILDDVVTSA